MKKEFVDSYFDNGFILIKNFFSNEVVENIKKNVSMLDPKIFVPGSNSAWGYGNLVKNTNFSFILNDISIRDILKKIHGDIFFINHIMIVNKVAWIGPDVEWHQEIANIDTYASGINSDQWVNFSQVFIALDPHTVDNGCLKIIPKSHKLGFMEHQDCINSHLNHKRRLTVESLNRAYSKYGIMNVIMNPGDALFFNHLLIHGSSNNCSPDNRMSLLLQSRSFEFEKSNEIFERETRYRKDYVSNVLNEKIRKLTLQSELYKDMHK